MVHPNIFYIYVPSYFYHYPINTFLSLFFNAITLNDNDFTTYINKEYKQQFNQKTTHLTSFEMLNKIKYFLEL